MNYYGSMEEEKKGGSSNSLAAKLKSLTTKNSNPRDQQFESFHTDQDLEGQTISLRDNDQGPKAMSSSQSTAESAASAGQNKPQSLSESLGARMSSTKNFVLGRTEPEPQGWLSIFNCLSNDKSYTYAIIAFVVSGLFGMLSFLMLAMIVAAPDKFVLMFTFAMISLITGFAFLKGPRSYVKNLFVDKNLYASITLIVSILLSLWFALVEKSYIWSLLFCLVELNAVLYFFCKTGVTMTQIKWVASATGNAVKSRFNK